MQDGSVKPPAVTKLATPWKRILLSPNMWFISLGYFCFFFGTNFYLTWYPDLSARASSYVDPVAGDLGLGSAVCRDGGRHRRRVALRHDFQDHRKRQAGAARGGGAGISAGRRVRDSGGADARIPSRSILCWRPRSFFWNG